MPRFGLFARRGRPAGDATRSESFRILRANLLVALKEFEQPTVIVTSALPGEGKTTTCANLATSLADAGLRVVAIDVDLRHPNLHTWFDSHNEVGLADVLLDRSRVEDALQRVEVGQRENPLYVLPSGGRVNDSAELLGGTRLARLLEILARQADIVLLDAPPVLAVADTLVIGRLCTGAILVVDSGSTPIPVVQQAKSSLIRNQTRILGMVLNKMDPRTSVNPGLEYYSSSSS